MRRQTNIAVTIALMCGLSIGRIPTPCFAESAADLAKSMQEQWQRCLKDSYQAYERRTPNRNAAAEMALQFCSVQEDALWAYSSEAGVSRSAFEKLRAAAKRALMAGK